MNANEKMVLHAMATRIGVSLDILAQRAERLCNRRMADAHQTVGKSAPMPGVKKSA